MALFDLTVADPSGQNDVKKKNNENETLENWLTRKYDRQTYNVTHHSEYIGILDCMYLANQLSSSRKQQH